MIKKEAVEYLKKMSKKGYQTHPILLDVFEDDEEVPDHLLKLSCHPYRERHDYILLGAKTMEAWENWLQDYLKKTHNT